MNQACKTYSVEWWLAGGLKAPGQYGRFCEWMGLGVNVNRRLMVVEDCIFCMGRRNRQCATCDGLGIVLTERMEL